MELQEKTASVTAAGRGIGAGIAVAFAREGASVVVNTQRVEGAADVVQQILAARRQSSATHHRRCCSPYAR